MDDDIFQAAPPIIEGLDYSVTHSFPCFEKEDLVITDYLWNGEYVDPWLLHEEYHIPPAFDDLCHQPMEIPQILSSSLRLDDPLPPQIPLKGKSAFQKYEECSTVGVQLNSAPKINQKSIKKCIDFVDRMCKSSKRRSNWEVDDGVVDEAYAFTRMISERKRRSKLSQLFMDLSSILPHNPKKVDKISTLSKAIMELNQKKLRIGELEQQNHKLSNAISHYISESYSSLSNGYSAYLGKSALMACDCEEAVVIIEESSIPEEAIIQVMTKKTSSCTHMDAIVRVVKCLREIKLEVEVVRIQSREIDATNLAIEVTIRSKTEVKSCTQTCLVRIISVNLITENDNIVYY
ncbi:uncharacterized protein LOC131042736 [Cryptomeria japonica]|uniref:uncharacterized protein LOC131042736 n=1 Tax=Cryptomeria japonica TaxID=3369 RepID=UPI0027DA8E4C|nr:uncharacterized protein LOC131042736 [Cryptomeria japonica]